MSDCVTVGEAKQAIERIKTFYRPQTQKVEEKRLHKELITGINRKYTI